MSDISRLITDLPQAQKSIRAKCFHPTGRFVEFKKEEIEQSIPARFEQIVRKYPNRLAVKTKDHKLTYDQLNRVANRVARAILAQCGEGHEQVALCSAGHKSVYGHSLAATRVISRVINTFKIELPIKSLFESPTVAEMAGVITQNMGKGAGDEELARMLAELEALSDEEAQRLLADEGT